jgi:UDP-glucose 4-epimerase
VSDQDEQRAAPKPRPSARARPSVAPLAKEAGPSKPPAANPPPARAASSRRGGRKAPAARARASVPAEASVEAPASSAPPTPAPEESVEAPVSGVRRRERSERAAPATEGAVLVTGICGRLGQLLARRLHRGGQVIGVDRRPFPNRPKDIVHYQIDMRRKKTRDVFRSGAVRAVVHLGVMHNPRASEKELHSWNVVAFQKLLEYLEQYQVPKLVVLSSANVYGPQPDNPQFIGEEAPLLGAQSFRGIRDLVELDMLAQSFFWRNPKTETVILRPCHILGRVNNAPSNYLRLDRPMTLLGFDPMVQVVHEADVVDAVVRALEPGIRGIFNLKGPGELPLSRILERLGRRPIPVPATVARAVLDRLWRYRVTSFPPPELDHIRYICMVDDERARTLLGYRPQRNLDQTLRAVLSDR